MLSNPKQTVHSKRIISSNIPSGTSKPQSNLYLWATIVVIAFICLIRFRLINVPLERDEGEYAYMGRLILKGMMPYKYAYSMKLPGTYFMYAIFMAIFGKSLSAVHIGLLIINAATVFILFLGFRKLYNASIAFFAASVYGLMAVAGSFVGFAAHATHFVSFFVAMAILFLARFYEKPSALFAFLTGLMFGLSFVMKQQAVFFLAFGLLAICLPYFLKKQILYMPIVKRTSLYVAGAILPYLLLVLLFMMTGAFDKFWFWTVQYAGKYATGLPIQQAPMEFENSFLPMWKEFGFIWLLFLTGLVFVFISNFSVKQKLFAVGFTVFAFITVCPGLYFRQHYFISFLPAVGLLSAISLSVVLSFAAKSIKVKSLSFLLPLVFTLCFITVLLEKKDYFLNAEPEEIPKMFYSTNPFVESVEIGDFIKQNSSPGDKIAVVGSEPQVYFYSDRFSATGYLYTYPLVENHAYNRQMQENMIGEIEKVKPKFIVYSNVEFSWIYHPGAPRRIYEWVEDYTNRFYEITGVVDIVNTEQTFYKWNEEAKNYRPIGHDFLKIYKRK